MDDRAESFSSDGDPATFLFFGVVGDGDYGFLEDDVAFAVGSEEALEDDGCAVSGFSDDGVVV